MTNLIKSELQYNGGLFPKIPERASGQDTLLVTSDGIAKKVDDFLTTKDIRKGNYVKVVRVSTLPFLLNISFNVVSKNKPYEFTIFIDVEGCVENSILYYSNMKSYDLSESIKSSLAHVVTPLAKQYELTDNSFDYALYNKLTSEKYLLPQLGIKYSVLSADAEPSENAVDFIKDMSDATLNVRVEKHKVGEAEKLTDVTKELSILTQVVSGDSDLKTAINNLYESNRKEGYNKLEDIKKMIEFIYNLQKENIISDSCAEQNINSILEKMPIGNISINNLLKTDNTESENISSDKTLNELLPDENGEASNG